MTCFKIFAFCFLLSPCCNSTNEVSIGLTPRWKYCKFTDCLLYRNEYKSVLNGCEGFRGFRKQVKVKDSFLTGVAFSLKATLPSAQWLCTHTHTHTQCHTQSVNQLVISMAVLMVRGVAFFPLPWRWFLAIPSLWNLCSWLPEWEGPCSTVTYATLNTYEQHIATYLFDIT